jgi:cytochrome c5
MTKKIASLVALLVFIGLGLPNLGMSAVRDTDGDAVNGGNTPIQADADKTGDNSMAQENPERAKSRGQLLYENHCKTCHESMVHIREQRRAKSVQDIQYWVGRWSNELDVEWSADEIEAVANYLNDRFYHY